MIKMKHYSDAGHGWLSVKRSQIEAVMDLSQISAYSYQSKSGQTVYLEEDGDASSFIKALQSKGIAYQIESVDHGDRSPIRSYKRFKANQNETASV